MCNRRNANAWLHGRMVAHLSRPVSEWIHALGLSEEDAARIAGLPAERLQAIVANDPSGVTASEADQAYHALLMHAREKWGDPSPEKQGSGGPGI